MTRSLKILVAHNAYQQRGGEDAVVATETRMLKAHGHDVVRYERHNDELRGRSSLGRLGAGIETVWAARAFREVKALIGKEKPDVAHFHNTFPLISPAAYYACAEAGVPVVQTLHNYRLVCPSATLLREGRVCEDCLGKSVPWPGVVHGCYRGSCPATAAVTCMLAVHRLAGTWQTKVNIYIALSEFARKKFIESGLPAERIAVKPNFVTQDFSRKSDLGDYVVFVGRLSHEKGPQLLPSAWRNLSVPLRIVGDGPLFKELSSAVRGASLTKVQLIGRHTAEEVRRLMLGARFLIFPSVWYEGFPMTIAEAFASGLPVIASRLGSMAEIVKDGVTGLHFEAGNAADLALKVEWAWSHTEEMAVMGRAARAEYDAKYTPDKNYEMLMEIYYRAMERSGQQAVARVVPAARGAES